MLEIRFHGRGGQGTVVASVILAKAFFEAGFYVQTFPLFGVERRGAPVEAYLRLNEKKILIRSNVYTPDHVVVQDIQLLKTADVTRGIKPRGFVLINSPSPPEDLGRGEHLIPAFVDATRIALENDLGTRTHPIINTAMVGAFARIMQMPSLEILSTVISREIPIKTDLNVKAAQTAYHQVQLLNL
jgi:pyruvate ferredoxin oxidoreductase gamma subunit/2-oxoisovalerate ferredoxin oxidoreductase gamma subunit